MGKRIRLSILLVASFFGTSLRAQQKAMATDQKMEWFQDAKLGIFIHWGIYSVDGISESWAFFNNYINHDNYMKQLEGFTASKYQSEEWARLIKNSGAKYSVITTRHHDGVSLWDSQAEKAITTSQNAAARKDVLTPFVKAMQKTGLKTGLYYSLPDWSHPYYDVITGTKKRYDIEKDPARWQKYLNYYQMQLTELSQRYHPDLLWFDGDWEHSPKQWKSVQTHQLLQKYNPNIIINSRLDGKGDYETPEQGIPVVTPSAEFWELCYTMNDSWGYQHFDQHYKTPNMIVRTLVDAISMGGNLLIDIGPKEDGTIPKKQIEILQNLGRWTKKNAEAVYGTRRGIPFENFRGKSALSKDHKTLFLYFDSEVDFTKIYGLNSEIQSAEILGEPGAKVNFTKDKNGNVLLKFSNATFDPDVTVVKMSFKDKISLRSGVADPAPSLKNILENKEAKTAVYNIANQLHRGNNILNDSGITSDGEGMTIEKVKSTNPEIYGWISKHAEALYQTGAGLPDGHYAGMSALSKDKNTLYLFVEGKPTGPIALKGVKNKIFRTRIVGEGSIIGTEVYNKLYWNDVPGIVYIDVPKERLDDNLTVIAVLLDGPVELYREKVGAVEVNK